ncbi:MAG: hypothetical protein LAP86_25240 [Acidobacteriia bacterium]|nr:hypothetical protein [Terriglobia bacterium]
MTHALEVAAFGFIDLVTSAVRSVLLAGVAGLGLMVFRARNTSLRLMVWTVVLYAALAMPLLGRLLPPVSVPEPGFLQSEQRNVVTQENKGSPIAPATVNDRVLREATDPVFSTKVASATAPSYAVPPAASRITLPSAQESSGWQLILTWIALHWKAIASGVYFAVAAILIARFALGALLSHRLVRAARSISDARLCIKLANGPTALHRMPEVAESDLISVPVTIGALHPAILLPSSWRGWDDSKLDAVIAHEMSHVARYDALTQRLSRLHRAVFWFSPLAWWLDGHLADLAEQASDEAALSGGADRNEYARTLLSFFEALHTTRGRVRWQGVAMAKAGQAEERLERILAWKGAVTMGLKKSLTIAVIALAIPVVYLMASVRPGNRNQEAPRPTPAVVPTAPAPPAPAGAPIGGVPAVAPIAGGPIIGVVGGVPSAVLAPAPPAAPVPPAYAGHGQSHSSGSGSGKGFSYAYGFDDEERFVIATGKSDSFTMSGSTQDARHVEKLKKQIPGDFIWFQRDEKSYIIRDQATIDRARGFWAGQEELGKKQEELGKQQEALGKQQEELGAKMEQVRVNVPDMTAPLDKLKAKLQKLGPSATMEQIGDLQSEIGELQSKIGEIQSHAGEEQSKLGELQGELGEKQGKLGEQQGKLGEQQAEIAEKATRQMKELLDEAIKNGTAKPEEEIVKDPTL